jgi:hypothetical protein
VKFWQNVCNSEFLRFCVFIQQAINYRLILYGKVMEFKKLASFLLLFFLQCNNVITVQQNKIHNIKILFLMSNLQNSVHTLEQKRKEKSGTKIRDS